jgi:hypothetical protein
MEAINWSTVWAAVAAISAVFAVIVYWSTLNTLAKTLEAVSVQSETAVFAEILEFIGRGDMRDKRMSTILNDKFDYETADEKLQNNFRDVLAAYSRAALLASTPEIKAKLLNFHADSISQIMLKHANAIAVLRSGKPSTIPHPDYARSLEELWNWGANHGSFCKPWNSNWPLSKAKIG